MPTESLEESNGAREDRPNDEAVASDQVEPPSTTALDFPEDTQADVLQESQELLAPPLGLTQDLQDMVTYTQDLLDPSHLSLPSSQVCAELAAAKKSIATTTTSESSAAPTAPKPSAPMSPKPSPQCPQVPVSSTESPEVLKSPKPSTHSPSQLTAGSTSSSEVPSKPTPSSTASSSSSSPLLLSSASSSVAAQSSTPPSDQTSTVHTIIPSTSGTSPFRGPSPAASATATATSSAPTGTRWLDDASQSQEPESATQVSSDTMQRVRAGVLELLRSEGGWVRFDESLFYVMDYEDFEEHGEALNVLMRVVKELEKADQVVAGEAGGIPYVILPGKAEEFSRQYATQPSQPSQLSQPTSQPAVSQNRMQLGPSSQPDSQTRALATPIQATPVQGTPAQDSVTGSLPLWATPRHLLRKDGMTPDTSLQPLPNSEPPFAPPSRDSILAHIDPRPPAISFDMLENSFPEALSQESAFAVDVENEAGNSEVIELESPDIQAQKGKDSEGQQQVEVGSPGSRVEAAEGAVGQSDRRLHDTQGSKGQKRKAPTGIQELPQTKYTRQDTLQWWDWFLGYGRQGPPLRSVW